MTFRGREWAPTEFAICMAFDAFRVALGGRPKHFTLHEIVTWLTTRAELGLS